MIKKTVFSLTFLTISITSWSTEFSETFVELDEGLVEIECRIEPIDRAIVHPNGDYQGALTSSTTWSGYVAGTNLSPGNNNHNVGAVCGTWIVPTLHPSPDSTYSAIWVGMDGYGNNTIEQIGTFQQWVGCSQENYAWFEMYPTGTFVITDFPVSNGDRIGAKVTYKGGTLFKLIITNYTKGVTYTVPSSYSISSTALRTSAEWIVEAPYAGGVPPLADF